MCPGRASWGKRHLDEHPVDELARLEYGMRGGYQAEHPAVVWPDWYLALKDQKVRFGTTGPRGSWKHKVLHGKEFRFYRSGGGKGLHCQGCIPCGSPPLLCRDRPWVVGRGVRGDRSACGAAIQQAMQPRQGMIERRHIQGLELTGLVTCSFLGSLLST